MATAFAPREIVLGSDASRATIFPVWDGLQLPLELVAALCVEYNAEIDRGQSFPETQRMLLDTFERYWFSGGVAGVIISGNTVKSLEEFDMLGTDECIGTFYIQPCFPGRSSHICTANFLVRSRFRGKGIGNNLMDCFVEWAPQLGYDYALFNLVYESNVAACKMLARRGFAKLSTIKGAGILKGVAYPVDAFMFGKDLVTRGVPTAPLQSASAGGVGLTVPIDPFASLNSPEAVASPGSMAGTPRAPPLRESNLSLVHSGEGAIAATATSSRLNSDYESMRQYLETGKYPESSDRTEKTRIRSRSRSYALKNGILVFKRTGAIVVPDPAEQVRIATDIHRRNHNGINKVHQTIAEQYYWTGIRDTITKVIRSCAECRAASNPERAFKEQKVEVAKQEKLQHDVQEHLQMMNDALSETSELPDPSSMLDSNIVYLPPENEDDEWVPEDFDFNFRAPQEAVLNGEEGEDDEEDGGQAETMLRDDEDDEWMEDLEYPESNDEEAEEDEDEDDDDEEDDDEYE